MRIAKRRIGLDSCSPRKVADAADVVNKVDRPIRWGITRSPVTSGSDDLSTQLQSQRDGRRVSLRLLLLCNDSLKSISTGIGVHFPHEIPAYHFLH